MGSVIHRARHGLICHEEQDQTIGKSLRIYGEWAEEEIYFLSAFIDVGAVVLDIGTNVGTHAFAFSRFTGARGLVIAIDAQERMHNLLVLSVALNAVDNIRCIRAIAGRKTGVCFVPPENHEARKDFGSVSYLDSSAKSNRGRGLIPVSMITLDDLSLERCNLIKIDVEGMELDVLLGAGETIARHRPPIYFEQARKEYFAETFEFFQRADYSLFWHVSDPFNRNNFRRALQKYFWRNERDQRRGDTARKSGTMATADGTASINCRTALRPPAAATRLGYWMVASGSGPCTFSTSRRQSVGETRRRNNIGYLKMTGYGMDYVEPCARNYGNGA